MNGRYSFRFCPINPAAEPNRVKIAPNPNTKASEWKNVLLRLTGAA